MGGGEKCWIEFPNQFVGNLLGLMNGSWRFRVFYGFFGFVSKAELLRNNKITGKMIKMFFFLNEEKKLFTY